MKLFEFEQIDSLKDLTEVPSDILLNEYTLINSSSETIDYLKRIEFKQIIKINLKTNSKQDVINVITKIKGFDEVLYVGSNYIYSSSSSSIVSSIIDKQWGYGN
ncbi:MAG: hypothetical protein IJB21_03090 [Bacilli bacterium]|nr:hypothetical protein [Bacilli bacterium]